MIINNWPTYFVFCVWLHTSKAVEVKNDRWQEQIEAKVASIQISVANLVNSIQSFRVDFFDQIIALNDKIDNLQSASSKGFDKLSEKIAFQENQFKDSESKATQFGMNLLDKIVNNEISALKLNQFEALKDKMDNLQSICSNEFDKFSTRMDFQKNLSDTVANKFEMDLFHKIANIEKEISALKFVASLPKTIIYFEDQFISNAKWNRSNFIEDVLKESNGTVRSSAKFKRNIISNEKIVVQFSVDLKGIESCGWVDVRLLQCKIEGSPYYLNSTLVFAKTFGKNLGTSTCNDFDKEGDLDEEGLRYFPADGGKEFISTPDMLHYGWETGILTSTFVLTPNNAITVKMDNRIIYNGTISDSPQPNFEICGLELWVNVKEHSVELLDIIVTNSEMEAEKHYQHITNKTKQS